MENRLYTTVPQWFRVRSYIIPALELAGTHNESDVLIGIIEGQYQLWPGKASAIVTEVKTFPKFRTIHFWLVGGELSEVLRMEEGIVQWGRSIGCTKATGTGRKGWSRALSHWNVHSTTISRDI